MTDLPITDLGKMTRGDDRSFAVTVRNPNGSLKDITGLDLWMTAKRNLGESDAEAVFQITTPTGIIIDAGAGGTATVYIVPADTADLPDQDTVLEWDVQLKEALGQIRTVAKGILVVEPDVTESTTIS